MPDFSHEQKFHKQGFSLVGGVDEVGRGCLAGPVIAAAVIFPTNLFKQKDTWWTQLDDSKKKTKKQREALSQYIMENVSVKIGSASVEEIDTINILQASLLAMQRAIQALQPYPQALLIDGNKTPKCLPPLDKIPMDCLIQGDSKSMTIAAASIVAKVFRDKMMQELALEYPGYLWEKNAGYGTKAHLAALDQYGPTPHHRKSFAPVAQRLTPITRNAL